MLKLLALSVRCWEGFGAGPVAQQAHPTLEPRLLLTPGPLPAKLGADGSPRGARRHSSITPDLTARAGSWLPPLCQALAVCCPGAGSLCLGVWGPPKHSGTSSKTEPPRPEPLGGQLSLGSTRYFSEVLPVLLLGSRVMNTWLRAVVPRGPRQNGDSAPESQGGPGCSRDFRPPWAARAWSCVYQTLSLEHSFCGSPAAEEPGGECWPLQHRHAVPSHDDLGRCFAAENGVGAAGAGVRLCTPTLSRGPFPPGPNRDGSC